MKGLIGQIKLWAGVYQPKGWMFCQGQQLQINGNESLFSLLGAQYGGDGRTTFNLPNFTGRTAIGFEENMHLFGFPEGQSSYLISEEMMPAHTHEISDGEWSIDQSGSANMAMAGSDSPGTSDSPAGGYPTQSANGESIYVESSKVDCAMSPFQLKQTGTLQVEGTIGLTQTGGGQPVDNYQPSLGLHYIICVNGTYPGDNTVTGALIGCINMFAFKFKGDSVVMQEAICDGTTYPDNPPESNFQALHQLIGTTFNDGANVTTGFSLPNLKGRAAVQVSTSDNINLGTQLGNAYYQLTQANLPAHSHNTTANGAHLGGDVELTATLPVSNAAGTTSNPADAVLAQSNNGTMAYGSGNTSKMNLQEVPLTYPTGVTGSFQCESTGGGSGPASEVNLYSPCFPINITITTQGVFPSSSSLNGVGYVGEIRQFAGDKIPYGWLLCDGSMLDPHANAELYAIIEYSFGSTHDGHFAIPNLTGRIPVGVGEKSVGIPKVTLGQQLGSSKTTLDKTQLPEHSHTVQSDFEYNGAFSSNVGLFASKQPGDAASPVGNCFGTTAGDLRYAEASAGTEQSGESSLTLKNIPQLQGSATVSETGSGEPYSNYMPSLGVNYIICSVGAFPQRD